MKHKKIALLLLAAVVAVALAACGSSSNSSSSTSSKTSTAKSSSSSSSSSSSGGKTLIIYFSPANSNTEDSKTAATPYVGNESTVAYIASLINKRVNADTAQIVPEKAYPTGYNATTDRAKDEQDNDERPAFKKLSVNPEDYDTIFVGYPMWWYEMPMIMDTFFDTYDFSGKTIIPFNTHAGSGDGGTYDDIKKLEPKATVRDGLAVAGDDAKNADQDVSDWLDKLGY